MGAAIEQSWSQQETTRWRAPTHQREGGWGGVKEEGRMRGREGGREGGEGKEGRKGGKGGKEKRGERATMTACFKGEQNFTRLGIFQGSRKDGRNPVIF